MRNKSEIVYVEDLCKGSIAEDILNNEEESDFETTEDEGEESDENVDESVYLDSATRLSLTVLYSVAMDLREHIRSYASSWYQNWPPLSSDITGDCVRKVVSSKLFNFMAWVLGYSDEPGDTGYVEMDENIRVKLFSICQDIVYNSFKGKTQTPKSLALATAVRQMSGCSGLVTLLNGFGHCVSLSSVMGYETAIAQLNIQTSSILPAGFVSKEPINLVYDNNDFGEEITKQTHVTNGIITHRIVSEDHQPTPQSKHTPISKSQRSLEAPESIITPYTLGTKKTPQFKDGGDVDTTMDNTGDTAKKLDLAYVLVKSVEPEKDEQLLPGWTGFNTLLYKEADTEVSRVGYLPVIDAPPTEYSTINAILKNSTEIADQLNLRCGIRMYCEFFVLEFKF